MAHEHLLQWGLLSILLLLSLVLVCMFDRVLPATTSFGKVTSNPFCSLKTSNTYDSKVTRQLSGVNRARMLSFLNPLPNLSRYHGPYKVGSTEFEIPVSEIPSSVTTPDPRVTTVKFRLYYPTDTSATSKKSIPWLPTPQKQWNQAYARFMGLGERRASWISSLPSLLDYVTIPAVQNAQLLHNQNSKQYPVVIFSHGLGGNYNAYSSLVGSLASCGVICVAPEHRDGSAPTSIIKASRETVATTIPYVKVSHEPTTEVLNARHAMLRTRLFEMDLVYSAISQMNQGRQFTNFAESISTSDKAPNLQNALDLRPSKVTWAGHSFGSATMIQLIKAVYYQKEAPTTNQKPNDGESWDMTPLYTPNSKNDLAQQITPESPVALLDSWTMPLRGAVSRWLWERPLPCYHRKTSSPSPNVVSIMSAEFYKWSELRNRTCAILTENADLTLAQFAKAAAQSPPSTPSSTTAPTKQTRDQSESEPELTTISNSDNSGPPSFPQSTTINTTQPTPSTTPHTPNSPVHLYLVPNSAHLSQSDFGVLFPNVTRYLMKALDPEKTMELNVRAVAAMMRGCGLDVKELTNMGFEGRDRILDGDAIDRFERLKLNA